jgi:hypothetical protein
MHFNRPVPSENRRLPAIHPLILAFAAERGSGQIVWKANEDVKFKFGLQGQMWADSTQNAETGGYGQNLFCAGSG